MLLIGFFHIVLQEISKYHSRRQLKNVSPESLQDMAISKSEAQTEMHKATLRQLLKDIIHSVKQAQLNKQKKGH